MTEIVKNFTYNLPDEPGVTTTNNNEVVNAVYTGPRYIYVFLEEDNTPSQHSIITDESGEDFVPMPGLTKVKIDAEEDPLMACLFKQDSFSISDTITDREETLSNGETWSYGWPMDLAVFDYSTISYENDSWTVDFESWEDGWTELKILRNSLLSNSDGKVASDVPEALRTAWTEYRQKLRDLPTYWDGIPSWKVTMPVDPDGEQG